MPDCTCKWEVRGKHARVLKTRCKTCQKEYDKRGDESIKFYRKVRREREINRRIYQKMRQQAEQELIDEGIIEADGS